MFQFINRDRIQQLLRFNRTKTRSLYGAKSWFDLQHLEPRMLMSASALNVPQATDPIEVAMIEDDFKDSKLSGREKLVLAFTDQYLDDPAGLSEALKAELLATFSGDELVHLSMVVAYFSGFSRCAVSLGGMPDELPVMEISVPQ